MTSSNAYDIFARLFDISNSILAPYQAIANWFGNTDYNYNSGYNSTNNYAANQGNGGWADNAKYGLTTVGENGCGIIAVYNLLKYMDASGYGAIYGTSFRKSIRVIEKYFIENCSMLFGIWGSFASPMNAYLNSLLQPFGISATMFSKLSATGYDNCFNGYKMGILFFVWDGDQQLLRGHYVMIRKSSGVNNTGICAYNMHGDDSGDFYSYNSIAHLVSAGGGNRIVPICFIRVNL